MRYFALFLLVVAVGMFTMGCPAADESGTTPPTADEPAADEPAADEPAADEAPADEAPAEAEEAPEPPAE